MDNRKEETNVAMSAGEQSGVAREKSWEELGIEEKLERLRRVLREQHFMIGHFLQLVQKQSRDMQMFDQHSHAPNGDVFVPIRELRYKSGIDPGKPGGYDPLA